MQQFFYASVGTTMIVSAIVSIIFLFIVLKKHFPGRRRQQRIWGEIERLEERINEIDQYGSTMVIDIERLKRKTDHLPSAEPETTGRQSRRHRRMLELTERMLDVTNRYNKERAVNEKLINEKRELEQQMISDHYLILNQKKTIETLTQEIQVIKNGVCDICNRNIEEEAHHCEISDCPHKKS